jgi:hypothetical protein
MSTIFSGTMRRGEPCQQPPSRIGKAMALTLTHWLISARCLFQMFVDGLDADSRHDQGGASAARRAEGAE